MAFSENFIYKHESCEAHNIFHAQYMYNPEKQLMCPLNTFVYYSYMYMSMYVSPTSGEYNYVCIVHRKYSVFHKTI